MAVRFVALDTSDVRRLQSGGADINGHTPERVTHPASTVPCRHCLGQVEKGDPFLILAYRPFPEAQPYAEQGPIFLHADACERGGGDDKVPAMFGSPEYIMRGYNSHDRIVYGSGRIVPTARMTDVAEEMFADPQIRYIHVRSSTNNCYHCRIDRA